MHPPDCPPWEYGVHPNRATILAQRVAEVMLALREGGLSVPAVLSDPRDIHHCLFHELTPAGYDYYAGHYRGEPYHCLRQCRVGVLGDPSVGLMPEAVRATMAELNLLAVRALTILDIVNSSQIADENKAVNAVRTACRIFELFLRIHPFANGNGHVARILVWAILGRYGYWPKQWPIEPRPADPPYTALLRAYRQGNTLPLEMFILESLV
jgi:fido (protein-threonine AMPylation protein)